MRKSLFADEKVPAAEVNKFKNLLGLSDKKAESACSIIRSWKGRDFFEPDLREQLKEQDRLFEQFFDVSKVNIDGIEKDLVHCNNVQMLIEDIIQKREVSQNHILKIGIDGGGGFLKVCLNVQDCENNQSDKKFSYVEGVKSDSFKDGGVKKLVILALVEDVKESHSNIKSIIDILNIGNNNFFYAFDMKLANLYFGIECAASSHPCPWCEISKDDMQDINSSEIVNDR